MAYDGDGSMPVVAVTFTEKGKLGINFVTNKDAKTVVISKISDDGLASAYRQLVPGLILRAVAKSKVGDHEKSLAGMNSHKVADVLKHSKRPVTLIFQEQRTVMAIFTEEGKLGMKWKDIERTGSVYVSNISTTGLAADNTDLYNNLILRSIEGPTGGAQSTAGLDSHDISSQITALPRPLTLTFEDNEWTPTRTVATFTKKGKLGISWKTDSKRKCVYITGITDESLASAYPDLQNGLIVRKLSHGRDGDNETNLKGMNHHDVGNLIAKTRPLTLVFNGSIQPYDSLDHHFAGSAIPGPPPGAPTTVDNPIFEEAAMGYFPPPPPVHIEHEVWDPDGNSNDVVFDATTFEAGAAAKGYDTTGDGTVDSWDTNGDGKIDKTSVSTTDFDHGALKQFTFEGKLNIGFAHEDKHLVIADLSGVDPKFLEWNPALRTGLSLTSVKCNGQTVDLPKDTFFEDAMGQIKAGGRPLTLRFEDPKDDDTKDFTFEKPGSIGLMFEHVSRCIAVTGVVKGSQAEHAEKSNGLAVGFTLVAVGGADGEMVDVTPDTYEDECISILKGVSRPVTLCFRQPESVAEEVIGKTGRQAKQAAAGGGGGRGGGGEAAAEDKGGCCTVM